jgi:hypothetical protein
MINVERLEIIFAACLSDTDDLLIEGIVETFSLSGAKVAEYAAEIGDMVNKLPREFAEGWSFQNMCMTKSGTQWADKQQSAEQLMVLGQAVGRIEIMTPRKVWHVLPGGVPFLRTI